MPESGEDIAHLTQIASIIVRVAITQTGASNEPTIPANPRLVIGRIEAVFRAGPSLGNLVGRSVTIELSPNHAAHSGQEVIFFANGLVYGSQIVLREVGHRHADPESEREIHAALEETPARHLKSRLEAADIVIVGTVEHVERSAIREPISFHAPNWMVAELHVANALKGGRKDERLKILFPSARDVLWARVPRFHEHEKGIFLLQRGAVKWGAPADALSALDPADFQPDSALPLVQQLLGRKP